MEKIPDEIEARIRTLIQSATREKLAQQFEKAAEALRQAAALYREHDHAFLAATHYLDAGKQYARIGHADAVASLTAASTFFCEGGHFASAAKTEERLAEFLRERVTPEPAITHYENAARYFSLDDSPRTATQMRLRAGELATELGLWQRALPLLVEATRELLADKATASFTAPRYCFALVGLHLAIGDERGALDAFARWQTSNAPVSIHRAALIDAVLNNMNGAADALATLQRIETLDRWLVVLWSKIVTQ